VRDRASASGEITPDTNVPHFLNLTIYPNSTDCEDSATYRCELNAPDVIGNLVVRYKDSFVDKECKILSYVYFLSDYMKHKDGF